VRRKQIASEQAICDLPQRNVNVSYSVSGLEKYKRLRLSARDRQDGLIKKYTGNFVGVGYTGFCLWNITFEII
jgi:hypothetical protein